ncbi:MAG: cation:proton antiporter [Acidimicrobiales bacterium]
MPLEFEFTTAPAVLAVFGLVALGMAVLPRLFHQRPLSFPLVYVIAGWALFSLPTSLPRIDPLTLDRGTVHLTEAGVIVALFGVGLKIGRPVSLRGWSQTWRLLAIAMPLTIGAAAGLAAWWLGFGVPAAVLFGAVLAPTDPVLASDVQQVSPKEDGADDVRFSLTSEAGLNDALAFPFTMLALAIASEGTAPSGWLTTWLAVDVVYRLAVGLAAGWVFGRILRAVVFQIPLGDRRLAQTGEGLVAIAGTFLTYGATELVEGYGFLAVFVAARVLRAYEHDNDYHDVVHDFSEQIERLVNGVILVLLGAAVSDGLLAPVTPAMVAVVAAMIFVVRPLTAIIALGGFSGGRWITSFFGIRGVGSLFYLSYALSKDDFPLAEELWAVVGLTVLVSIAVHGLTAGPVMYRYDHRSHAEGGPDRDSDPEPEPSG